MQSEEKTLSRAHAWLEAECVVLGMRCPVCGVGKSGCCTDACQGSIVFLRTADEPMRAGSQTRSEGAGL